MISILLCIDIQFSQIVSGIRREDGRLAYVRDLEQARAKALRWLEPN